MCARPKMGARPGEGSMGMMQAHMGQVGCVVLWGQIQVHWAEGRWHRTWSWYIGHDPSLRLTPRCSFGLWAPKIEHFCCRRNTGWNMSLFSINSRSLLLLHAQKEGWISLCAEELWCFSCSFSSLFHHCRDVLILWISIWLMLTCTSVCVCLYQLDKLDWLINYLENVWNNRCYCPMELKGLGNW